MMTQVLELGGFSPDIAEVVRQLRQDLKDDWYPDSLAYEDALKPEVIGDFLTASFEKNHGQFVPEGRTELNVPKKGFILRYSLEMSLPDRLYYHALVGHLVPFYDPLLPNNVLNHRYAGSGGRYLFKRAIKQWQLFRGYVVVEAVRKPVILETDVENYYEHIEVKRVIEVLESNLPKVKASGSEKARIRWIIAELDRCLRKWCYEPGRGLPQNRDASSFLANLVMLSIDRAMLAKGYAYYRYMDDIRVAVATNGEARAALQLLTTELRLLGLNINSSKNNILEPGELRYEAALRQDEPLVGQIDSMWRSKSLPVIRRSFVPLKTLAENLIRRNATEERAFRFCVNRFNDLALCPALAVPKVYFDSLIEASINELASQPFSSDTLVRFLKAAPTSSDQMAEVVRFLVDPSRHHYDWQNYLLWQLMVYKEHGDPNLIIVARERAEMMDRPAERAGAFLYLGAMGSGEDRRFVCESFKSCEQYLVQRNALIAIHEIKFHLGIEQHVKAHVIPSLDGTYRRLRDGFLGQYYRPLPPKAVVDIYDEIGSYD